jgi:hypothetical protein
MMVEMQFYWNHEGGFVIIQTVFFVCISRAHPGVHREAVYHAAHTPLAVLGVQVLTGRMRNSNEINYAGVCLDWLCRFNCADERRVVNPRTLIFQTDCQLDHGVPSVGC